MMDTHENFTNKICKIIVQFEQPIELQGSISIILPMLKYLVFSDVPARYNELEDKEKWARIIKTVRRHFLDNEGKIYSKPIKGYAVVFNENDYRSSVIINPDGQIIGSEYSDPIINGNNGKAIYPYEDDAKITNNKVTVQNVVDVMMGKTNTKKS